MKKWWKEQIDKAFIKSFLHYYQASDSELTSVCCSLLLVDFDFSTSLVVVNILPYFRIPVSNF